MKKLMLLFGLLLPMLGFAQSYSIDWYKIAGGGGTSTGATYQVAGTIGQPDASGPMTGGSYSLTGGFWSLIAVVQMSGSPALSIRQSAGNAIVVAWPYPSTGFGLQQNANLGTTNWVNAINVPVHVGDEWQVTVSPPASNRFYRLVEP